MEETRTCTKCGEVQPLSEYAERIDRGRKRREARCKTCRYHERKAYSSTAKGRAVLRESRRRYRLAHPEGKKYQHLKAHTQDPEHFNKRRVRNQQIHQLAKVIPSAPRDVVAAIVDTRAKIRTAKKHLKQKDQ